MASLELQHRYEKNYNKSHCDNVNSSSNTNNNGHSHVEREMLQFHIRKCFNFILEKNRLPTDRLVEMQGRIKLEIICSNILINLVFDESVTDGQTDGQTRL